MKVLKGQEYTKARLAGIAHEMYVAKTGKIPPTTNITQYGDGQIVDIDGEVGLLLNESSVYFAHLPQIHKDRLIEFVEGGA